MTNTKRTQKDTYTLIKSILTGEATLTPEIGEEICAFCDTKIGQLDAKAAKAKEKAAEKKATNDQLGEAVLAALTDEPATIDAIVEAVEFEGDVTRGKVVNRLTKLVAAGEAVKSEIAVKDGESKTRKVSAYALVSTAVEG